MKRIDMVSLLRLCCTLSIVLCHIFQFYGNELAWWLNIGVQIFLLISGFLYGSRTISNGITFLLQNFKKILIDYYIVVLCLIPVYIGWTDVCLSPEYLLRLLLGLGGVPGLEHTWFISTILLCYCVTPLLQKIRTLPRTRFTILLALCVLIEVVCHALPDITGAWINCYILGYCLGFLPAKQPVVLYTDVDVTIQGGKITRVTAKDGSISTDFNIPNPETEITAQPIDQDGFLDWFAGYNDGFENWGYLPTPGLTQAVGPDDTIYISGRLNNVLDDLNDDVLAGLNHQYFTGITDADSLKSAIINGGFGFTAVEKVGFIGLNVNGEEAVSCVVEGTVDGKDGIYTLKHATSGNSQYTFQWKAGEATITCDISEVTF